jgi:glutathione S-transferase
MTDVPRLWSFATSPFSGKVRAAFAEKGVEFELVEIHPKHRPARLTELSRLRRVPVLELGDLVLRESSVICEWIEDTYPQTPLWPSDPDQRGWARMWGKYLDDGPAVSFFLGMRKMAFGMEEGDPQDIVARLHGRVGRQLGTMEDALAVHDGPWLCGEQFTLADICAMPLAVRIPQWMPALAPDAEEHPRVCAWMQALRERPSAPAIEQAGPEVVRA